jgi:hypothetical protein
MAEANKYNRRHFIGTAAMSVAAAQLGTLRLAKAQRTGIPRSSRTFAQIKQIDAGVLNVGYAEMLYTQRNSRANINTASSLEASDTICPRLSPKRSKT